MTVSSATDLEEETRQASSDEHQSESWLPRDWNGAETTENGAALPNHEYYVPLAELWHYHKEIKNREGRTEFHLLQEDQIGRIITGEPIFRMIVGNARREVVAVIVRDARRGKDGYTIYGRSPIPLEETTIAPNDTADNELNSSNTSSTRDREYSETHPTAGESFSWISSWLSLSRRRRNLVQRADVDPMPYRFDFDDQALEMYPLYSIQQGVFGKSYLVQSWKTLEGRNGKCRTLQWKAENANFRKILLCCPCIIFLGVCMWRFEFQDLNTQRRVRPWNRKHWLWQHRGSSASTDVPVMIRDQEFRTLTVASGASPLLALCVTYAMDRLTRSI